MTGCDPGQWLAAGALIGTVIGWYLRRWWCSVPSCDHEWSDWQEIGSGERYRNCLACMKLETEGKEIEE